jgi:hypothetical protein
MAVGLLAASHSASTRAAGLVGGCHDAGVPVVRAGGPGCCAPCVAHVERFTGAGGRWLVGVGVSQWGGYSPGPSSAPSWVVWLLLQSPRSRCRGSGEAVVFSPPRSGFSRSVSCCSESSQAGRELVSGGMDGQWRSYSPGARSALPRRSCCSFRPFLWSLSCFRVFGGGCVQ